MDNKHIKSILEDALEDRIPGSQINLLPSIQSHLVAGKTLQQGEQMNKNRTKRLVLSVLTSIVILTIALLTPQGRAFAQRIFLFFTVTEEKSFPIPTEQVFSLPATGAPVPTYIVTLQPVEPSTNPTETPQPDQACSSPEAQSGYYCQIKAVEAQAGFGSRPFSLAKRAARRR